MKISCDVWVNGERKEMEFEKQEDMVEIRVEGCETVTYRMKRFDFLGIAFLMED